MHDLYTASILFMKLWQLAYSVLFSQCMVDVNECILSQNSFNGFSIFLFIYLFIYLYFYLLEKPNMSNHYIWLYLVRSSLCCNDELLISIGMMYLVVI